ncbi:MAG: GNAT family N-acetyltransferase [Phycisphaerae bacterium]|jgi:ribosomal protein S18 acetylase RimI-like enzyme
MWFYATGELVGYVQYDPSGSCDMTVLPSCNTAAVEELMIDWAEQRCDKRKLTVGCLDSNLERRAMLERRGFQSTGQGYARFLRDLTAAMQESPLPAGYRMKSVEGIQDFLGLSETGSQIYGRSALLADRYERMLASGQFVVGQDIVVLDSQDHVAAACIWWYDEVNQVGEFEPIGCHPAHRRKGLASALIAEGCQRIRSRGGKCAIVYTSSKNVAAVQCYETCGFKVTGSDCDFFKVLKRS